MTCGIIFGGNSSDCNIFRIQIKQLEPLQILEVEILVWDCLRN